MPSYRASCRSAMRRSSKTVCAWHSDIKRYKSRRTASDTNDGERMLFPTKVLEDFAKRIFLAAGSDEREAKIVADHLVDSAVSGHDSHGVIRILAYITAIKKKELIPNQHPTVRFESDSMIVLEGNHGYGQV